MLTGTKERMYLLLYTLLFAVGSMSCEEVLIESDQSNDPAANVDFLWTFVQEHYPYLAYKNIDWEAIREEYRAPVNPDMSDRELFGVLSAMLGELEDGHVNLVSPFQSYFYDITLTTEDRFDFHQVEKNYLTPEGANTYQRNGAFAYTILDDNVGYVHYPSFGSNVSRIDDILDEFEEAGVRGLILDVRDNGGGQSDNALGLAGRFTDQSRPVGYSVVRTGPQASDLSEDLHIQAVPVGRYWQHPVMLLTNRGSYSACSYFTEFMRQMPQVTVVGDTTGGGGGMPLEYELPNGWSFRLPVTAFYGLNDFNIENGVPPDVYQIQSGQGSPQQDEVIERARELLR